MSMKEKPILFSAPMVRAILDGRKSQTRRIVKPQPVGKRDANPGDLVWLGSELNRVTESNGRNKAAMGLLNATAVKCPYGQPGDVLWVRETIGYRNNGGDPQEHGHVYAATPEVWVEPVVGGTPIRRGKGCPSIHMPRWACRIRLRIKAVRVERLQEISEADAIAEGVTVPEIGTYRIDCEMCVKASCLALDGSSSRFGPPLKQMHRAQYWDLWDKINGPGAWALNPFVWVVEFERVTQ